MIDYTPSKPENPATNQIDSGAPEIRGISQEPYAFRFLHPANPWYYATERVPPDFKRVHGDGKFSVKKKIHARWCEAASNGDYSEIVGEREPPPYPIKPLDEDNYRLFFQRMLRKGRPMWTLVRYDDKAEIDFFVLDCDFKPVHKVGGRYMPVSALELEGKREDFWNVVTRAHEVLGDRCLWFTSPGDLHEPTGEHCQGLYAFVKLDRPYKVTDLRQLLEDFVQYHRIGVTDGADVFEPVEFHIDRTDKLFRPPGQHGMGRVEIDVEIQSVTPIPLEVKLLQEHGDKRHPHVIANDLRLGDAIESIENLKPVQADSLFRESSSWGEEKRQKERDRAEYHTYEKPKKRKVRHRLTTMCRPNKDGTALQTECDLIAPPVDPTPTWKIKPVPRSFDTPLLDQPIPKRQLVGRLDCHMARAMTMTSRSDGFFRAATESRIMSAVTIEELAHLDDVTQITDDVRDRIVHRCTKLLLPIMQECQDGSQEDVARWIDQYYIPTFMSYPQLIQSGRPLGGLQPPAWRVQREQDEKRLAYMDDVDDEAIIRYVVHKVGSCFDVDSKAISVHKSLRRYLAFIRAHAGRIYCETRTTLAGGRMEKRIFEKLLKHILVVLVPHDKEKHLCRQYGIAESVIQRIREIREVGVKLDEVLSKEDSTECFLEKHIRQHSTPRHELASLLCCEPTLGSGRTVENEGINRKTREPDEITGEMVRDHLVEVG